MSRKPLSKEQRAERDAERAELFADKRKRTPKTDATMEPTDKNPGENNTDQNTNPVNNTGEVNPPVNKPDPTPAVNPPVEQNSSTENTGEIVHTSADLKNYKPDTDFSMLGGNRKVRSYSTPKINADLADAIIPEPQIGTTEVTAQSAEQLLNPVVEGPKPTIIPQMPGFDKLTPPEQQQAAAQTADMLIGGYDTLHRFGRKILTVDEEHLKEMHRDDKMDIYAEAFEDDDDPNGKGLTIKDYFLEYNKEIEKDFVVTPEFKDAIRPPLERICIKRGWGTSDEMFIAMKVGEDLIFKGSMVYGFKKHINKMMDDFMADHERTKAKIEKEVAKATAAADKRNAELQKKLEESEAKNKTTTATDTVEETTNTTEETKKD